MKKQPLAEKAGTARGGGGRGSVKSVGRTRRAVKSSLKDAGSVPAHGERRGFHAELEAAVILPDE